MIRILILILLASSSASVLALDLQEILNQHAEALGGRDRLDQITSAEFEFDVSLGTMTGTSKIYLKAPDRFRSEVDLPIARYVQACAGDDCWMSDGSGLTHALGSEFRAALMTQIALSLGSYLDIATFDGQVELVDTNQLLDSTRCFVITLAPKGGLAASLWLNQATFLIEQTVMKTDLATIYSRNSDYRRVDGIMVPFRTQERTEAGMVMGVNRATRVVFNGPIDNSLFRDPRSGTAALATIAGDSVVVPFEIWNNHVYVEVTMGDKRRHRFIFDSGAGGAAINLRLTDSLPLKKLAEIEAHGVGGAQQSPAYLLERLELGGLIFDSLPVFGIDLSPIERAGGRNIDGIIGYDLLGRCIVSINYDKRQLVLYNRDLDRREDWGTECPLMIDFRLPYVEAVINDSISGLFRIDTGSGSTIDFNSPFVKRHSLVGPDRSQYREVNAVGIGGGSAGLVGQLPSIELCRQRVDSLTVNYSIAEKGIFAGERTAGNIGAGVLRRFRVTFDYENEKLYLSPVERYELLQKIRNMAGVSLTSSGDTLVVDRVLIDSAADRLLKTGDRLLSLNGTVLLGLSPSEADRLLTGDRGDSLSLEIRRSGEKINVKLMLDTLY